MIKAIETRYKGYRFRSRLEARWAVFFDALGLKWEYEPEGFELPGGFRYLPDFKVRDVFGGWSWVEVKGVEPSPEDLAKAEALYVGTGLWVAVVWGEPPAKGQVRRFSPFSIEDADYAAKDFLAFKPWGATAVAADAARSARFEFGESGAAA